MVRIDVPAERAHEPYAFATETHATDIMAAAGAFAHSVYRHSSLSLREFEGARSRIAEINGCIICQQFRAARDMESVFAGTGVRPDNSVLNHGAAPDEDYYADVLNWRTSTLYSARERLAIEFAERFAEEPKELAADENFWNGMKTHFNDNEIVDLAHCAAAWMGLGRVAHVLGFDSVCTPPIAQAAE